MKEKFDVKIIPRDGMAQAGDDYHATVTRKSDGYQLIYINTWLWVLKLRTRRGALKRAFKYHDKRDKKLAKSYNYKR